MFEIIKAGGIIMVPIILCSIGALAIVLERLWSLQRKRILPPNLVYQVSMWAKNDMPLDARRLQSLSASSPLGRVLAIGLANRKHERSVMKEAIEEVGAHVAHDMGRYLNTLGSIAAVSPLLGLLGTVFGMIQMFNAVGVHGAGDPQALAGGIGVALITTAAGLCVAIPALLCHRFLRSKVEGLVVDMEQEAVKLVEVMQGARARGLGQDEINIPTRALAQRVRRSSGRRRVDPKTQIGDADVTPVE